MSRQTALVLALVLGVPCAYIAVLDYGNGKIRDFCASIGPQAKMSDLPALAARAGVTLTGPLLIEKEGGSLLYASARNKLTMGEYGCRVRGDAATQAVTSKTLGS